MWSPRPLFSPSPRFPAQAPDRLQPLNDQLGRIFQANEYSVPRFGPARWLPDGTAYTTVEKSTDRADAWDIVRYDAATGARSIVLAGTRLVPQGSTTPLGIDNYVWSPDGKRLLIFTDTKKVWRDNTRGDYWVLDLSSGELKKLGGAAPESSLMFARFSPDNTRVAYVRANNIYVEKLADGSVTQLTSDGSATTSNGTSDWVYEEELGVRDSLRWSPDSANIAYWQFDSSEIGTFSLINSSDSLYPVVTNIPYPKAGTTNSAVRIGVIPSGGGQTRWMKTPGDPRENYLARMEWLDARTIAIQQLNRLQNENDFLLADVRNGEVRRSYHDESKAWVDVEEVQWIDKGQSFLWTSERDGWRHIFRVPREGGEGKLVTRFGADILEVAGLDEAAGLVYFIASPETATDRYLYRSKLDGTGTPERVTPTTQPGTHSYDIGPTGKLAFHTYSRFDQPPVTDVVDLSDHRVLRTLTDTSALVTKLAPIVKPPVEFFRVDIDGGVSLDGWMLKPSHFDPARRYPVIVHVYGEPASQTVVDRWGGGRNLFHRALAEAGYIVVSFDNRGTPAPKGAAWRKVIYGTVGDLSSKEQARSRARAGGVAALHRSRAHRRVGLERRRLEHAQLHVPLSRGLPGRCFGGTGARSEPVRHHLSRALHGHAAGQRRGLSHRVADQLCRRIEGTLADRARVGRRQRALPGNRTAGESPDCPRQAVRLDGVSESYARNLRGARHDGPHLPPDRALLRRASAAGSALDPPTGNR